MHVQEVLRTDIHGVGNPLIGGLVINGEGFEVLMALDHLYLNRHMVFSGSVQDHIEWAAQMGMTEHQVRQGFQELVENKYLTLDGDIFTPSDRLIYRYM